MVIGRFDGAQKWMERKDPKRTIIEPKKCCLFSTISSTVHDKEREKEMVTKCQGLRFCRVRPQEDDL